MADSVKALTKELLADGVIDDDELAELTKDELREMVQMLNGEAVEHQNDINDLKQELAKLKKSKKGIKGLADLEAENESLREQVTQSSDRLQAVEQERDIFKDELKDIQEQCDDMTENRKQLEIQLKTTRKALDDAEKELQKITDANRQNMRQSQESSKLKKDSQAQNVKIFDGTWTFRVFLLVSLTLAICLHYSIFRE